MRADAQAPLALDWQPVPGGARLVRAYGSAPCVVLPDTVEGQAIVEIGPYCFSASEPRPDGEVRHTVLVPGRTVPLAGRFVRELALPAGVRLADNAAFYNCRALEVLRAGPALRQTGSDLLNNCFALRRLEFSAPPEAPTALRKLLGVFGGALEAAFEGALLFYPEYAEEIDVNAPAHVFNHTICGLGYRYRQCFNGDAVNYAEYDAAFMQEKGSGEAAELCRLALGRLRQPYRLSEQAASAYRAYLARYAAVALEQLVRAGDRPGIEFLLGLGVADRAAVDGAQALALRLNNGQTAALLMDWSRRLFGRKTKSYEF